MAYLKYKELTKYFYFSEGVSKASLPEYVFDYIYEDEQILDSYKTMRDYGVFTDKKMVLFDRPFSFVLFANKKEISIIPYKSISTCSIIFRPGHAELGLMLDSGYPVRLKFTNMTRNEKARLRKLYACISKIINNQNVNANDINGLNEAIEMVK